MSIHRRALARVFSSRRFHGLGSRLQQQRSRRKKRRELQLETLEPRAMLSANAPPENTVPSDIQDAIVNQPFAFTAYRGNQISITDTDAAGNLEVTLGVDQGFLTLVDPDPNGALTYSAGNGTEDATMTFQGTAEAINTALTWVAFVGDSTGPATLTITTDDSPHMNAEGESDTDTIQITVGAVPAFAPTPTHATYPSALDPEIGAGLGWVIRNPVGTVNRINDMQQMPDGTFVAVGAINDTFAIFRVLENMNLDEGGFGTQVGDFGLGVHASRFAIDSEGRFLVVGGNKIVRFTSNGKLDESFGNEGIVTCSEVVEGSITDIQILPNGNFAISGWTLTRNRWNEPGGGNLLVNEYDSGGSLVRSLARHTYSTGRLDQLSPQPYWLPGIIDIRDDGDFLLASHSTDSLDVVRTSRGGTQEQRYDVELPGAEYHRSSVTLPDGKFLLIGKTNNDVVVTRHLPSGAHDTTFGTGGVTKVPVLNAADEGYRATLAQDGKILISGFASNGSNNDIFVIRLHHDGTLDETFDTDGIMSVNIGSDDRGHAIIVTADNKIVIGGRSGNNIALVRLLGDSDQSSLPPNQAPINSVPGAQTVTIDQSHAFTEYRGNLISISDADAGNNHVQVTLEVTNGTVTLANNRDPRGGITYIEGDGFEDATVTFSGTITDINEALEWVSYQPATEYLGNDTLTITTTDNGHLGSGGSLSDIDTIAITVSAVEDFATTPSFHTEPSALDSTFGNGGIQLIEQSAGTDFIHSMRVLETSDANNGKVVAVGAINNMFGVMRFNADMTADESFGQNGGGFTQFDLGPGNTSWENYRAIKGNVATAFAVDNEGRILVVGGNKIVRFTSNGKLDESFGNEGIVTCSEVVEGSITDIQILPNGNFAISGWTLTRNRWNEPGGGNLLVNEYDSGGSLVRSLARHTYSTGRLDQLSPQPYWLPGIIDIRDDGDFLLASHSTDSLDVVRTSRGGTQEQRYDVELPGAEYHRSSVTLPDGKFLLIGKTNNDVVVTRHLPSGAHDTTFGTGGVTKVPVLNAADEGYRATLAQDGKILISGFASNGSNNDIFVIRLHHDGTLDETFDTDGIMSVNIGSDDRGHAIIVTADNKIVIGGRSGNNIALVRLLGDSDQSSLPPNQAPINSVPGAQTVTIDQSHAFTEYRGNLISISDADAGNNHVQVTLEVTNGTVTLANNRDPRGGITYIEGDGFEDATVTFSGTITDINEALEWVSYRNSPSTSYMQWEAADGGNDHWYEFVPTTKTWAEAKTDAEARGGYLATVTSTPESKFINNFLYEIPGPTPWLGGYQEKDGTFFTEPDRGWNWVTDEPFAYLNWKTGEPNDTNQASNQDYLQHQNIDNDGKWADANGSSKHGYFVEYESDPREAPITGDTLTITTNDLGSIGLGEPRTDIDTIELAINPPEAFQPSPGYTTTPAALDPTFDQDGRQILSVTDGIDFIHSMRVLETSDANNGKVVAVGAINNMFGVMRFNADMTADESFGQNGGGFTQFDLGPGNTSWENYRAIKGNVATAFAVDNEGRILVVGGNKIVRFTSNGKLDESFGNEGIVTCSEVVEGSITDIQILPNGNFAISGWTLTRNRWNEPGGGNLLVNEYDSGGSLVRSLARHTYSTGRLDQLSPQPYWLPGIIDIRDDGDFLLASHSTDSLDVVRTSRGGTQEQRYDVELPGAEYHRSSVTLPDGKFLLIGKTDNDVVVTRHLPSGILDLTFGTTEGKTVFPALSAADEGYRATLAQDGKILISGFASNGENNDIFVARLTPEGLLDDTFGSGGTASFNMNLTLPVNDYGYAILSVPEGEHKGKIIIAGRSGDDIAIIRLMGDFDDRQPPSNITLTSLNVDENSGIGTIVGTFNTIDDNAPILSTYSLIPGAGSTHNDLFVIDGSTLTVNGPIDYETNDTLSIRVRTITSDGRSLDKAFTITVNDINEAPVAITLTDVTEMIAESEDTTERIRLATMAIDDDALGIETISITGDDATDFEIDGDGLFLRAGTQLDFEAKNIYQITISAIDDSLLESVPVTVDYTLIVFDTNRPPSNLVLTPDTISLPEDTDTSTAIDLAAITFNDDTTGTNTLSLTGAYADMFELGGDGTEGYRVLLKARALLDFETEPTLTVTVAVADETVIGSNPATAVFTIDVTDVNEAPTAIELMIPSGSLPQQQTLTSSPTILTKIAVIDDALGTNTLTIGGPDAEFFGITDGSFFAPNYLALNQGTVLDHATKDTFTITLTATDESLPESTPVTIDYQLQVEWTNDAPTDVTLTNTVTSLPENTLTEPAIRLADIGVTDDGYGEYEMSLTGPDAQHFFIDGTNLFLQAGTPLNFEEHASYQVTVVASDTASLSESTSAQAAFTLSVVDVNEPPTQLNVTPLFDTLPELSWNDVTKYPIKVADVSVTDDALGTHPITLSGPDADAFDLAEGYFYPPGLYLKAGTSLDFEVKPTLSVVLTAQDPALPDAAPVDATFSLTLENVNEPPFDLRLTEVIDTIPEDSDTTGPIRLAKVGFIDDGTGTHTISLAGPDTNAFQVVDHELFLKAGTPLDFNQKNYFSVTVTVDDNGIPDFTPLSVAYDLNIENVNFRPVLDTAPTQALTGVPAGAVPTPGSTQGSTLVSDLLKRQDSSSTFTDRDADAPGIAIVKTHLEGGALWYSTNNGTSWYDVGEVSGTNARLLFADSMTRLAYQPGPDMHQTLEEAFSFKAWDRTGGFANGHTGVNTMVRFGDATTGTLDTPGFAHAVALAPHGRTAFVGDRENGVHVVNLLDRQQPELLSTFETTGAVFDVVTAPAGLILVADGHEGIKILEVTSSHTLQEISRLTTEGTAQAITLSADAKTAFVANGTDGVLIVNITDSANPQLVRRINTLGNANDVALSADGNTMFVANGESGVRVFDITDPLVPRTLDIVETNAQAKSIVLSPDGRLAAVANGSGGLVLFNSENSAALSQLSRVELAGTAKAVTLDPTGKLAYVTGSRAGLHSIDISKPRQPLRIHTMNTPGYASDVTLTKDGHHALVADWNEGFRVLRVRPPSSFSAQIKTVSAEVTPQPASIQLIRVVNTIPESTSTAGRIRVADILVTPSTDERYELTLSGPDTAHFEVLETGLYLHPGTLLDFETQSRFEIAIQATTPEREPLMAPYVLELTDANEPPFALRLTNGIPALADSVDTSMAIRIADISFDDDALGTAVLSLGEVDATIFELRDTEQGKSLFLRAGTTLNAETRPRLQVVVKVADPTLPFAPEKVEWAVLIGANQPPPPPDTPATISGRVKYAVHENPLAGVTVQLNTNDPEGSPTLVDSFITTTSGLFSFPADRGNDYELTVTKSENVQALTAHDAAFVLQHLAEQSGLNEMQVLSADYDGSGRIDALDAGLILQDSLGTSPITNDGEGSDWIFRPRALSYENLTRDAVAQNFVGILRGDVTANWSAPPSAPTTQPVHVRLSSPDLAYGFTGKMILSIAGGNADVFSANMTIEYDPAVLRITPGDIRPATSDSQLMVAARNPQEGRIVVAIASATPLPRDVPLLSIAAASLLETAGSPIAVTAATLNEGSIPAVLGSSNAKTLTPIDENGTVRLGKGRDGRIYANGHPLRINGTEVKDKVFGQFDLLEAETVHGKNIAHVRRNNGKTYRWNLSEEWEFEGIETIGNLNTVALPRASRGPEFISPERTVIEDHGNIALTKDSQGYIYANGNQIYLGSQPFNLTEFQAFTPLAAETVHGRNQILISTAAGIFEQAYDRHWRSVGMVNAPQPVSRLTPTQIGTIETTYGVDIDDNDLIKTPSLIPGTVIEANGSITLSYRIQEFDGAIDPHMIVDPQIVVYANEYQILPRMAFGLPQNQWLVQPVAAESIDGVNKVLVRLSRPSQPPKIMEWTVSNDWASPVTTKILVGQEILEAEANYEVSLVDPES